jgi:hypothetical protein
VGGFQGRMEWGPRALGHRSILADPRRIDMKKILNEKIKRRELFRPFAPSILREAVGEWFEQEDDVPVMMEVFQIRPKHRELVLAVTHVDGSGRLHTVTRETNPRYYSVIEHFRDLTEVPMILNTSFNENEPIVCYPEEALDCFLRTKMDVLVLENFFLEREGARSTEEGAKGTERGARSGEGEAVAAGVSPAKGEEEEEAKSKGERAKGGEQLPKGDAKEQGTIAEDKPEAKTEESSAKKADPEPPANELEVGGA